MITNAIDHASSALESAQTGLDAARSATVTTKRVLSTAAGTALMATGLRRGGVMGAVAAFAGADLVYHGLRGEGHLFDVLTSNGTKRGEGLPYGRGVMVKESVLVARSADELYAVWRDFENLPAFMENVESVKVADDVHSHWIVKGPLGNPVKWNAEVIADRKSEIIGWRTEDDETVAHAGSVRFEPVEGQSDLTRVTATFQFNPPAGASGASLARLVGADPQEQVRSDLKRFKQFAESMDLAVLNDLLSRKQSRQPIGDRQ